MPAELQESVRKSRTTLRLVGTLTMGHMLYHAAAIEPAGPTDADVSRALALESPLAVPFGNLAG